MVKTFSENSKQPRVEGVTRASLSLLRRFSNALLVARPGSKGEKSEMMEGTSLVVAADGTFLVKFAASEQGKGTLGSHVYS